MKQLGLLKPAEVAVELNISRSTVRRLWLQGELPAPVRVGKQLRWRREDVDEWLQHREPATAAAEAT